MSTLAPLKPTKWALGLLLVLLLVDCTLAAGGQLLTEAESRAEPPSESFGIINWSAFTRMFKKNYSSLTQQLVRHKLFIARLVQVSLAASKWALKLAPNYLVINKFSDLAPHEEMRLLSGDQTSADDRQLGGLLADEQVARLLAEELESVDREPVAARDEPKRPRRKRDVSPVRGSAPRHRFRPSMGLLDLTISEPPPRPIKPSAGLLDVRDLVRFPSNEHLVVRAKHPNLKWWVPAENPFYEPHDSLAQRAANTQETIQDIPEDQLAKVDELATGWLAKSAPSDSARPGLSWAPRSHALDTPPRSSQPATGHDHEEPAQTHADDQAKVSVVHKDWRETGCIAPPHFQGDCLSCYAISSMAFIEWAYCMNRNRVLTPLSAQYLVSCGPQFMRESAPKLKVEFNGCRMGRSRHALLFVQEYGAELEVHMPYLAQDAQCPVAPNTPAKLKGYLRPNVKSTIRMASSTKQLDRALQVGPVIVVFRAPVDFVAYGGGMVQNCHQEGSHAMLIVGHGIENNIPYLLIKNSFGTDWGEGGYFKFDRRFTQECVREFFLPRVRFPSHKSQARRIKAHTAYRQSPEADAERVEPGNFEMHIDKLVGTS